MARFLNVVLFSPTAGGTTDFTVSAAVQGYMTPNAAGAANGAVYRYRAENATLTEWEVGYGTYNTGTGVLTRTVVLYNSLGTTAKINFTAAPNVGMGMPLAADIFPLISDTPPTDPDDGALWWESDTGVLYIYYNDGTSKQWVGIQSQSNVAAVLFTAQSLSDAQKKQARSNIGVPSKNYLLNGAMMVSQEVGAGVVTADQAYPVDQWWWRNQTSGGVANVAQVASVTPAGSPNRLRVTVTTADAAIGAAEFAGIWHKIEGLRVADLKAGTASPKSVTIQFGVKAPAGTYGVSIRNSAVDRAYVAEFTIAGGEANTDVVKSVTIPLDNTGTWLKDTGVGMYVAFCLSCGATFQIAAGAWTGANGFGTSNQFNFFGTLGNVFELFDVSMTEGVMAPAFQVPDFAAELELCRRYWEKSYNYATLQGTATHDGASEGPIATSTANFSLTGIGVSFKTPKRSTPAITTYSSGTGTSGKVYDLVAAADLTPTVNHIGENGFRWFASTTPATQMVCNAQWVANARL